MNAVPHGRPGPDLVQTLVDALTLLDCVRDRTQRVEFVDAVAYRLGAELTYPDSTPRIDMMHLVRKVIHRPGGPEAIVYAVRAVSGRDDAERIAAEAGIRTEAGFYRGPGPRPSSPKTSPGRRVGCSSRRRTSTAGASPPSSARNCPGTCRTAEHRPNSSTTHWT